MMIPAIKILALLFVLTLLSACEQNDQDGGSSESLLANGFFEDGLEPWYTAVHADPDSFTIDFDAEHARRGAQSVRIVSHGTEPWGGVLQFNQNPVVDNDSRWQLQGWLRGQGVTEAPELMVAFHGRFLQPIQYRVDTLFGDFEWTRVDLEFDAPAGVRRIEIGFVHHGLGTLWVDNATLVRIDP